MVRVATDVRVASPFAYLAQHDRTKQTTRTMNSASNSAWLRRQELDNSDKKSARNSLRSSLPTSDRPQAEISKMDVATVPEIDCVSDCHVRFA